MMYLGGNRAEIYGPEERKVVVCSPEGVAGLQKLVDLVRRDRLTAPEPETTDFAKAADLFYNKRTAILNGSNANIGEVEKRLREGTAIRGRCCRR
jgi:hypothetical protein